MADIYENILIGLDGVESTIRLERVGGTDPVPENLAMQPVLQQKAIKDPRDVFRILTLQISAVVTADNDVSDLFTEEYKQWMVYLYRDTSAGVVTGSTVTLFQGWLQNDTIREDFVNTVYNLEMKASDGLDELSNSEYLDINGNLLTGTVSLRTVINTCINRIGINNGVWYLMTSLSNDNFPVRYFIDNTGAQEDFWDIRVDQRTFRREADKAKPCKDVLTEILTLANAYMYQYDGQWWIMWRGFVAAPLIDGVLNFTYWDNNVVEGVNRQIIARQTIGSRVNGFNPFWANENQFIERRPSLSAAKIYYKFGDFAAINENAELNNAGTTPTGWSVFAGNSGSVTWNPDGTVTIGLGSGGGETNPAIISDLTTVSYDAGGIVSVELAIVVTPLSLGNDIYLRYRQRIRVSLVGGSDTYNLDPNGTWTTDDKRIEMTADGSQPSWSFTLRAVEPTPESGQLRIEVFPVDNNSGIGLFLREATLNFIKLGYMEESQAAYTQESHTVTQNVNKSPVVFEPKTVNIGPWLFSKYVSSLSTAILLPLDSGFVSYNPGAVTLKTGNSLFEVAMRDALSFESKIARDFSGDIYGYIPIWAIVTVDGFPGKYMIASYTYDVVQNTVSLLLFEMFFQEQDILDPNPWFNTLAYTFIPGDGGTVITPAVRG